MNHAHDKLNYGCPQCVRERDIGRFEAVLIDLQKKAQTLQSVAEDLEFCRDGVTNLPTLALFDVVGDLSEQIDELVVIASELGLSDA